MLLPAPASVGLASLGGPGSSPAFCGTWRCPPRSCGSRTSPRLPRRTPLQARERKRFWRHCRSRTTPWRQELLLWLSASGSSGASQRVFLMVDIWNGNDCFLRDTASSGRFWDGFLIFWNVFVVFLWFWLSRQLSFHSLTKKERWYKEYAVFYTPTNTNSLKSKSIYLLISRNNSTITYC